MRLKELEDTIDLLIVALMEIKSGKIKKVFHDPDNLDEASIIRDLTREEMIEIAHAALKRLGKVDV